MNRQIPQSQIQQQFVKNAYPNQGTFSVNQYQAIYSNFYAQISRLKFLILAELFKNKALISRFKHLAYPQNKKQLICDNFTNSKTFQTEKNFKTPAQFNEQIKNNKQVEKLQDQIKSQKRYTIKSCLNKQESCSSYYPYQECEKEKCFNTHSSQTKNIPKNFGSSIMNFIRKHPQTVKRLLKKQNKCQSKFKKIIQHYKSRLKTIADLRDFWSDSQNSYSKICRILSIIYLRKHSLQHIFNSRIQNHSRHIKYRYKIIQGVKNPQIFSQIKDF